MNTPVVFFGIVILIIIGTWLSFMWDSWLSDLIKPASITVGILITLFTLVWRMG